MLKAKLVVVGGDAKAAEVQLKLPTIIGRGKEASLTVPHGLVSRLHTEILERDGRLYVRDLGSLNGTYVNNTRIENEQPLDPNQLLTLGNITFRAVYEIDSSLSGNGSATVPVAFEEVSDAKSAKPKPVSAKHSISEVVSFRETIPMDLIEQSKKSVEPSVPEKISSVEPAAKETPAKSPAKSVSKPSDSTTSNFFDTVTSDDSGSASDTDKSFVQPSSHESASESAVFAFESDGDPASKSVSASALDSLPTGQSAVSFLGNVELGEDARKPLSQIDPVKINLGENEKEPNLDLDSGLGSFLKKLPR